MALFKTKTDEDGELFKSFYEESDYAGWELKIVELTPNFFRVEGLGADGQVIAHQGFDPEQLIEMVEKEIGELVAKNRES
jgi:hypothetical protein